MIASLSAPTQSGSYALRVAVGFSYGWIARNYKAGRDHRYVGGLAERSPVRLAISQNGHWHVVGPRWCGPWPTVWRRAELPSGTTNSNSASGSVDVAQMTWRIRPEATPDVERVRKTANLGTTLTIRSHRQPKGALPQPIAATTLPSCKTVRTR